MKWLYPWQFPFNLSTRPCSREPQWCVLHLASNQLFIRKQFPSILPLVHTYSLLLQQCCHHRKVKMTRLNNENTQQYNRIHLHHLFIYNILTIALAFNVTHTRNNKYNGKKVYYIFAWLYGFLLYLFFLFYISSFYTLLVLAGIMVVSRQMGST